MSQIARADVERLARLARLRLEPSEVEGMASDLAAILGYVEQLSELETDGVAPTSHVTPLATPLREDRVVPSLDPEVAVAGAPAHEGSAFAVPAVLEDEEEG